MFCIQNVCAWQQATSIEFDRIDLPRSGQGRAIVIIDDVDVGDEADADHDDEDDHDDDHIAVSISLHSPPPLPVGLYPDVSQHSTIVAKGVCVCALAISN